MRILSRWIVSFLLFFPSLTFGQEDIFQVKTPNVMIIFDTSSSMDKKPDQSDAISGNVCVDTFGRIQAANGGAPPCSPGYTMYHFEGGANHPSSKLYQAKLALKEVIEDVVKDRVNLGFATYAQSKTDRVRGRYVRNRSWLTKKYWAYGQTRDYYTTYSSSPNSFTDHWNQLHHQVSIGYAFTRPTPTSAYQSNMTFRPHPSGPNLTIHNLQHEVYEIAFEAEYNRFRYRYRSAPFWWYWERDFTIENTNDCESDRRNSPFPNNQNASGLIWKTYFSNDTGAELIEYNSPSFPRGPHFWKCSTNSNPKDYSWFTFNGTVCPEIYNDGTYVWSFDSNCYDFSSYTYPADGSIPKPHIWSYFKMSGGNWHETHQTPNYYPSRDGGGNFNNNPGTHDNRYFFINFPDDKDAGFTPAIRTENRNQIMSFLDLTPVQNPETKRWWTKLPVHAYGGRTGLTSNTIESLFTPLADSLKYGFKYFYDYIHNFNGGDPASRQSAGGLLCRGNYIILLTDGLESARLLGGLPDYTAAATEAANLKTLNVKTFVIGFGTDLQGNKTLNNIASAGGTCKNPPTDCAYFAVDLPTLKLSIESIFQLILGASYGRSNPVITKSGDRIFKGFFEFTSDHSWKGGLYAYDVDKATGNVIVPQVWDAGEKLTHQGRGTVWTWRDDLLNPSRHLFDMNTSVLYSQVYPNPRTEDIDGDGNIDDDDAKTIIGYTLDPNFNDTLVGGTHPPGYHKGQRPIISNKGWKLGDIYHSTPVFIGAPPFAAAENDYNTFYLKYRNRTQMVYVGANDGMLHGFKNTKGNASTDGREHIAIIPKNLLGKVKNLRATHEYYVDATPKAYDVFFNNLNPPEKWQKWRTVLITGLREGGPYYFAVDVTNPDGEPYGPEYPRILWEWTDTNMGGSWAKPDVGKIKDGATVKYVAFITGGYSVGNNIGNSFYVVDIETGTTIKKWVNLGANDNKIPSGPTAFDANGDGLIDFIYFGDTKGTLWRVNVTSSNINEWSCDPLFIPPSGQRKPIFYSPTVAKNRDGKILIFFGTGEELNLLTVTDNYFWEVWDDKGTGRIIGSNWPKILTGQKVLSSPVVANYVVYFTTWLYTAGSNFCGAGSGRLYGFKISNAGVEGGLAGLVLLDGQNMPEPVTEFETLGPGIPTSPIVTNGNIYISSNVNAKDIIRIKFLGWPVASTRSWREVF